jgi:DNA-binding response OmpR family regulator
VLDVAMPGIDGLEVCRRLREWSLVPVLVLSARTDEIEKVNAREAGADDYVTKPFSSRELVAPIRAALRREYVRRAQESTIRSANWTLTSSDGA